MYRLEDLAGGLVYCARWSQVGGIKQSMQRKPTQTQGAHVKTTEKDAISADG